MQLVDVLSQARNTMISKAVVESAAEAAAPGSKEGAWKWAIRKQVGIDRL